MNFKLAAAQNEAAIKRLLESCDLHHQDLSPPKLAHFLLAWDGARLVGVIGLEILGNSALLRSLAVETAYRNRNIATRLVGQLEDYAKSLQVDTLYLLTLTAEDFFAKQGYRRTARDSAPAGIQGTTEFRNLCPVSAVCMVKQIEKVKG
jgi:amino-acid N-acetyltransferase